ncbi:hypothetical protein J1N35_000941 [Gossypium stocksii]|uniref:Uncharacterized protein n=1 Tax=Gossypium stocksii TaxID=47602 RepID=A0A9D3WJB2_9ROSI|nr:hypothetical protein J1N35_000941 [Gossypium stocksii]
MNKMTRYCGRSSPGSRLKIVDLISLSSSGADRIWKILSLCIGNGVDFSHHPYLPEVAREQVEDFGLVFLSSGADRGLKSYSLEIARKQTKDFRFCSLEITVEQIEDSEFY